MVSNLRNKYNRNNSTLYKYSYVRIEQKTWIRSWYGTYDENFKRRLIIEI